MHVPLSCDVCRVMCVVWCVSCDVCRVLNSVNERLSIVGMSLSLWSSRVFVSLIMMNFFSLSLWWISALSLIGENLLSLKMMNIFSLSWWWISSLPHYGEYLLSLRAQLGRTCRPSSLSLSLLLFFFSLSLSQGTTQAHLPTIAGWDWSRRLALGQLSVFLLYSVWTG